MLFEFASGQIQGKRSAQEDTIDVLVPAALGDAPGELARAGTAPTVVSVVADGMGGHVGGRIASNLSSKYFLDAVAKTGGSWGERLDAGLHHANEVLRDATERRPDLHGMGSTLVGAILTDSGLGWVSIGDSGLYLQRNGRLQRLNEDHSFGAYLDEQAAQGLIPPEVAAADRRRNQLFHALLGYPLDHYESFSGFIELAPGDVVVLASDGLKTLTDRAIGSIIDSHRELSPERIVAALLDAVEAAGRERQDNTSVILARVVTAETAVVRPAVERPTTVPLGTYEATVHTALDLNETGDTALIGVGRKARRADAEEGSSRVSEEALEAKRRAPTVPPTPAGGARRPETAAPPPPPATSASSGDRWAVSDGWGIRALIAALAVAIVGALAYIGLR